MQKFVNDRNVTQLISPLSAEQADSLESYLTKTVVSHRGKDEFVVVLSGEEMLDLTDGCLLNGVSLVSYGSYDKTLFSDKEKTEIADLLICYGRKWDKESGYQIDHSLQQIDEHSNFMKQSA
jgi:hypothetical protein